MKVATISGQRRPLETGYAPRLQPLLVTSLGRTGTTLLMRMLAAHPGVVVYARPPYEARGGKYWLHVLKTLAAPTDARKRVGAPMEFHLEPLAAGRQPLLLRRLRRLAGGGGLVGLDLCRGAGRLLPAQHRRLVPGHRRGAGAGRTTPLVYFAEKHFPDAYPRLMRELYPGGAGAVPGARLPRHGRLDAGLQRAQGIRRLRTGDGRERRGLAGRPAPGTSSPCATPGGSAASQGVSSATKTWCATRHSTLPPLLTSLGLDAAPETVSRLIAAAAPDAPELRGHGTAGSPDGLDRPVAKRSATGAAGRRRGDVWRSAPGVRLRVAGMISNGW